MHLCLQLALASLVFICSQAVLAQSDWSENAIIPPEGRANILQLDPVTQKAYIQAGLGHALQYPVEVTGLTIPLELIDDLLVQDYESPLRKLLQKAFQGLSGLSSFEDFEALVGLISKPDPGENIFDLPQLASSYPTHRLGTSLIETEFGTGVTFSCAACHMSELFGVPVPGLTNRFPRANEFFVVGKKALALVEPHLASAALGLSANARRHLQADKAAIRRVESRMPVKDGLDTSLSHVALSLSHRNRDAEASFSSWFEAFPRYEPARKFISDSKPSVWWNVKYKNKWLADGSGVSGNPIYTNILWNEIGRGTSLTVLLDWLNNNQQRIDELTAAVFATRAPRYTEFFPADAINLESAQRGQQLFNSNCMRCHGHYEKSWDQPDADRLEAAELLATVRVKYFANTPIVDVGTDPNRYLSMTSALQLNDLALSKAKGIKVKVQNGYVPPPLEGIWARWPYFHNNSAPSLCAVLTKGSDRPERYYAGEAVDRNTDFDATCNGYPTGDKVPAAWKTNPRRYYDASLPGLSNRGHDEGVFLRDGEEMYSPAEKQDIIEFLKTL